MYGMDLHLARNKNMLDSPRHIWFMGGWSYQMSNLKKINV
jgi:hypothetical protein